MVICVIYSLQLMIKPFHKFCRSLSKLRIACADRSSENQVAVKQFRRIRPSAWPKSRFLYQRTHQQPLSLNQHIRVC